MTFLPVVSLPKILSSIPPTTAILLVLIVVIGSPLVLIPISTFLFATLASLRNSPTSTSTSKSSFWSGIRTSLYSGRVSHVRYSPAVHHFSYPLFFCFLDLDEVPLLFGKELQWDTNANCDGDGKRRRRRPALWPLNYLMDFRADDHLKNGEGLLLPQTTKDDGGGDGDDDADWNDGRVTADNSLSARIRRLVSERTDGACCPSPGEKLACCDIERANTKWMVIG